MRQTRNRFSAGVVAVAAPAFWRWIVGALVFCLVASGCARTAESTTDSGAEISVTEVAGGLGVPWGMAFVGSTKLLVTERSGDIRLLDVTTGEVAEISGAPEVKVHGQGGLLDVAVPPDYASKGWVYLTYSKAQDEGGATALGRARLTGTALTDWQELLVTRSASSGGRHFGSRITFVGDNYLFFGVGDRGHRPNGQDLTTHAGAILRIFRDGSVPEDNPFSGEDNVLPEIWSYGHRNPQGLAYDPVTQRLWSNEHGPRGGDEINLVRPGLNYGWPVISHGKEYTGLAAVGEGTERVDIEPAVKVYIPSIAPSSLLIYSGTAFPQWRGNLFSGALKLTHLNRVALDGQGKAVEEERLLEDMGERIRSLAEDPGGHIYFGTDSGKIYRVSPADR